MRATGCRKVQAAGLGFLTRGGVLAQVYLARGGPSEPALGVACTACEDGTRVNGEARVGTTEPESTWGVGEAPLDARFLIR